MAGGLVTNPGEMHQGPFWPQRETTSSAVMCCQEAEHQWEERKIFPVLILGGLQFGKRHKNNNSKAQFRFSQTVAAERAT